MLAKNSPILGTTSREGNFVDYKTGTGLPLISNVIMDQCKLHLMQLPKEMVYASLTSRLSYATVNVATKYPLPIIILSLRQCMSILRQVDVERGKCRTQKRSHAKKLTLEKFL